MTKLLNIDEDYPEEFYIFVNQLNLITHHNFNLAGRFTSGAFGSASFDERTLNKYLRGELRILPFQPCEMDAMALSPYFLTAINDYRIEYDAEIYRKQFHQLYPSRLSAIYAFGDYETCVSVNAQFGWPLSEVVRFRLIQHPLNRIIKVNMQHISLARHAYKVSTMENAHHIWENYWQGSSNIAIELPTTGFNRQIYNSGIIWEYLIEGVVEKIDS